MSDVGNRLRIGLVQLCSGRDRAANIEAASTLIRDAHTQGARYIQTPETTHLMEPSPRALREAVRCEEEDPGVAAFSALARELGVFLHIGSLVVDAGGDKAANRAYLFAPDGSVAARYDKIHLFDVDLPGGERHRESHQYRAGERAVTAELPGVTLGLTICYDLRFPQLYRALAKAGAGLIAVPSAFTRVTGEAHWHVLLRARAIETGAFIAAAAQGGRHDGGRETFGHSLIVAPWGEVLAEGGAEPGVIVADLDLARIGEARSRIPALTHDRPFAGP